MKHKRNITISNVFWTIDFVPLTDLIFCLLRLTLFFPINVNNLIL